jgi:hypothetical protein
MSRFLDLITGKSSNSVVADKLSVPLPNPVSKPVEEKPKVFVEELKVEAPKVEKQTINPSAISDKK